MLNLPTRLAAYAVLTTVVALTPLSTHALSFTLTSSAASQHTGEVNSVSSVSCPGDHTACPAGDTCCIGKSPDPYRVQGGYGCMPPGSAGWAGCAGGGTSPQGCCCGPGPSNISTTVPNVLVIGDSVSAGYTPYLRTALGAAANVQHGPDNAGGGNADGSGYGALCMPYFVRTPLQTLPPWKVITFNFGLHDGATNMTNYTANLKNITETLVQVASDTGATLIYVTTTIPGGAGEPPAAPDNLKVQQLNRAAVHIVESYNITVLDLYETMESCGEVCDACQPHCDPAGYQYLVEHGLAPAVKKALGI